MKIDEYIKKYRSKSIKAKLLGIFVLFGLMLLGLVWIMQSVLLERYYELSMEKKCRNGITTLSSAFAEDKDLGYEEFCEMLGNVSSDNDLYIYVESGDGRFSLSSTEVSKPGRVIPESNKIFSDAKRMLSSSYTDEVSFTVPGRNDEKMVVFAKRLDGDERGVLYLYALAFLSPIGPAVNILRSQLIIVTVIVLALGVVVAYITSRHLAAPLAEMSENAKRLGSGDFDVRFKGADYEEINELADTLNEAALQLKMTDSLRKDLMANVSHDLRTPLTMIKSYAEMIRDLSGDNKAKREEHLGVIIEETDRLSELVDEILVLSKVQSGTEVFQNEVFDIQEAAEDIVQTYKIMESEGYTISFETLPEKILVSGDESRIKQVMSNLISNAVKYSEDKKEIKVFFERRGDFIRFNVKDRGVGIPEDQLAMIWTRYERASQRGSRTKEGSGLGLSICSEILKRSGAEYGVESKLGEGSCFWFEMKAV
ncbi:MAG: HAMP domain-containing histidine kinase [Firmicutes bacterium]|nr:HAMP domain-containing histidine kinase [Bacillota bacterium]